MHKIGRFTLVCFFLGFSTCLLPFLAGAQSLAKFDTLRLENELTFDVPTEKAEEVWAWLKSTFGPGWRSQGITFQTFPEVEEFADTYFDTPEMTFISQGIGVRHRRRFYPDGAIKELIQIKQPHAAMSTGEGSDKQTRGEIKFEPRAPTITYREGADLLNEEILQIVKREHLEPLRARLSEMGAMPDRVAPFMAIEQQRRRVYFRDNGTQLLTVTLDLASTKKLWVKGRFVQLDIEIGEIAFTTADEAMRQKLLLIQQDLQTKLLARFPELKRNQTPKVVQMVNVVRAQGIIPYVVLRFGWTVPLVAALVVLCMVLMCKQSKIMRTRSSASLC